MSWSVTYSGKPELILKKLDEQSALLSGMFKQEFDEALPNLKGLIAMNTSVTDIVIIELNANGYAASSADGKILYQNCNVSIKRLAGMLI